jgi:hypothetical protein
MVKKSMKKTEKNLEKLAGELAQCGPATRGSIVLIGMKTKQYYLSVKIKEKTKLIFLGKRRVEQARIYLENYKKILDIIEKMTYLVIERLRKADPE